MVDLLAELPGLLSEPQLVHDFGTACIYVVFLTLLSFLISFCFDLHVGKDLAELRMRGNELEGPLWSSWAAATRCAIPRPPTEKTPGERPCQPASSCHCQLQAPALGPGWVMTAQSARQECPRLGGGTQCPRCAQCGAVLAL